MKTLIIFNVVKSSRHWTYSKVGLYYVLADHEECVDDPWVLDGQQLQHTPVDSLLHKLVEKYLFTDDVPVGHVMGYDFKKEVKRMNKFPHWLEYDHIIHVEGWM